MKTILSILLISLAGFSCSQNIKTEEQRIKDLQEFKAGDEFMKSFLMFLHKNDLEKYLVQYESELLKRKSLTGTDEVSYAKYFKSIDDTVTTNRCIPKEVKAKLFTKFFTDAEDFKAYTRMAEQDKMPATKEYTFITYLIRAELPDTQQALAHALSGNTLTLDKKYFYLMCTVPFKECDQ